MRRHIAILFSLLICLLLPVSAAAVEATYRLDTLDVTVTLPDSATYAVFSADMHPTDPPSRAAWSYRWATRWPRPPKCSAPPPPGRRF